MIRFPTRASRMARGPDSVNILLKLGASRYHVQWRQVRCFVSVKGWKQPVCYLLVILRRTSTSSSTRYQRLTVVMEKNSLSTYRERRTSAPELSTLLVSESPPAVMDSPPGNEVRKIVSSQRGKSQSSPYANANTYPADSQLSSSVAPTEDVVYDITSNSVDGDSGQASTTGKSL